MNEMKNLNGDWYPLGSALACVGKGWHRLVAALIEDLFALGWDGSLYQIKEKFGGLRFYIGSETPQIADRILKAEGESLRTCEVCGRDGKQRGQAWITTRCDECHQEDELRKKT